MSLEIIVDGIRLLTISYLLVLATAAVFVQHRPLLAYPFHALYSVVRIALLALTFGRVQLAQEARRTRLRQARRIRGLQGSLSEWRERREEERALARGEDPYPTGGGWSSAGEQPESEDWPQQ